MVLFHFLLSIASVYGHMAEWMCTDWLPVVAIDENEKEKIAKTDEETGQSYSGFFSPHPQTSANLHISNVVLAVAVTVVVQKG